MYEYRRTKTCASPKPHRVTVALSASAAVISLIALLVSFCSYRVAKKSSDISAATSESAVEVTELNVTEEWRAVKDGREAPQPLRLHYALENLGKMATDHVTLFFSLNVHYEGGKDPSTGKPMPMALGNVEAPEFHLENLPPGAKHQFDVKIPTILLQGSLIHLPEYSGHIDGISVNVRTNYQDGLRSKVSDQCFYRNTKDDLLAAGAIMACNLTGDPVTITIPAGLPLKPIVHAK